MVGRSCSGAARSGPAFTAIPQFVGSHSDGIPLRTRHRLQYSSNSSPCGQRGAKTPRTASNRGLGCVSKTAWTRVRRFVRGSGSHPSWCRAQGRESGNVALRITAGFRPCMRRVLRESGSLCVSGGVGPGSGTGSGRAFPGCGRERALSISRGSTMRASACDASGHRWCSGCFRVWLVVLVGGAGCVVRPSGFPVRAGRTGRAPRRRRRRPGQGRWWVRAGAWTGRLRRWRPACCGGIRPGRRRRAATAPVDWTADTDERSVEACA